jgi:hypothetical protein
METFGILSRAQNNFRGAFDPRRFIVPQSDRDIFSVMLEAARQHQCVFERHVRTLCKKWKRRMTGVAEKAYPPVGPARQRIPADQCPLVGCIDVTDDFMDIIMPPGKIGRALFARAGVGPGLALPVVALDDADEIEQVAATQWIVDDVASGADPVGSDRIMESGR